KGRDNSSNVADGVRMAGEKVCPATVSRNGCDLLAGQILSDGPIRVIQSDHPAGKRMRQETGRSQPAHKLQTRPPGKGPRCAKFLCRIWYLCWNLTKVASWFRITCQLRLLFSHKPHLF